VSFGRFVRIKGEREARMAELSEFGVALSRMMDRRAIGFPSLAALLAERGYRGVIEDELRDYVESREPLADSLPLLAGRDDRFDHLRGERVSPLPLLRPRALSQP